MSFNPSFTTNNTGPQESSAASSNDSNAAGDGSDKSSLPHTEGRDGSPHKYDIDWRLPGDLNFQVGRNTGDITYGSTARPNVAPEHARNSNCGGQGGGLGACTTSNAGGSPSTDVTNVVFKGEGGIQQREVTGAMEGMTFGRGGLQGSFKVDGVTYTVEEYKEKLRSDARNGC